MAASRQTLQLTLAIFKPNVVSHPHLVHQIKDVIHRRGFLFIRSKRMHLTRSRVEDFYREHEGRFFYNRLISFMSSGPISTHILARENSIAEWRKLMGATKVFKTIHDDPDSIRGKFGLTDTRNSTHGSDSDESALKEMHFFFPEFDVEDWYSECEKHFVNGDVYFDEEHDVHRYKLKTELIEQESNKSAS